MAKFHRRVKTRPLRAEVVRISQERPDWTITQVHQHFIFLGYACSEAFIRETRHQHHIKCNTKHARRTTT